MEILEDLVNYSGFDQVVTWPEYLEDKEKHSGKSIRLESGFNELDSLIDGFQTGELITISGFTGMGKTLFLKSLVRSFGLKNVPVLVFSYEDSVERYLSHFKEEGLTCPVYVPLRLETGNMEWMQDRILEAHLKYDCQVVTIDHLHYLMDSNHGKENLSLKIGSIMRFLKKKIAEDLNLVTFIIAHQEKAKEDQEASLNTIRDSSLIGHESDDVIIVQRMPDQIVRKKEDETFESGYSMVKIDKARRSGVYRKRLTFKKVGHWLEPL